MPRSDTVALVTGGSSGIGRGTALALATRGLDVAVTYCGNEAGAHETVAQIRALGRRATAVALDLRHPETAEQAVAEATAALGPPATLVNNAGVNRRVSVLDETTRGWESTLAVNLIGPWACARAVAEQMIEVGLKGRIINVTSVLAFAPIQGGGAYCAAKAGLELLTKVLALELAPYAITVNAVAPGHTATPMNYPADELDGEFVERPVIPLRRAATADEVGRAVAFLVAGDASYVTGSSLLVDGGLLLASGPQTLEAATALTAPSDGR